MGRNSFLASVIAFAMIAPFLSCFCFFAQGQSETAFTPTDTFEIPVNNSTISFAVSENGFVAVGVSLKSYNMLNVCSPPF